MHSCCYLVGAVKMADFRMLSNGTLQGEDSQDCQELFHQEPKRSSRREQLPLQQRAGKRNQLLTTHKCLTPKTTPQKSDSDASYWDLHQLRYM